jgi:hypothetical protein
MNRVEKLYDMFVEQYEDDSIDYVEDFLEALINEYEDATDSEILSYVIECVSENNDYIDDYSGWVISFSEVWGKKIK